MLHTDIQSLIVSKSQLEIDKQLLPFDLWGTTAHVIMLKETGIIRSTQAQRILTALNTIAQEYEQGHLEIEVTRGAQLSLEKRIIELAGEEAGLAMHTARSRNDQVMVAELLFLRETALGVIAEAVAVSRNLLELGTAHVATIMPGYTHMQPAKPTTFAHWCLAHFDSIARGIHQLEFVFDEYNKNPLGAVESFGTSWPIDRERTTKLLGFASVWEVPLDAISSRGTFQVSLLAALSHCALSLSRMAVDLLQYSTFEYGFVNFSDTVAQRLHPITGSSVMAQKRNPDALELIRSLAPQVGALHQAAFGILCGLPSGYNRDSRETKEYIWLGVEKSMHALKALQQVLRGVKLDKDRMLQLVESNYSLTTDLADFISQETGYPYRLVYKIVGEAVDRTMRQKLPLRELSIEQLNEVAKKYSVNFKLSDVQLEQATDPTVALSRRGHVGGTSIERTTAMLEARTVELQQVVHRAEQRRARIDQARRATQAAVEAING